MATAVFSFKVDPDGKVRVLHVFFAAAKHAADAELHQHVAVCPKYGPAYRADETIEFSREIEELPPADGDALEEWLDELLATEGDEADDEPIDMVPEEDS
jgi:hypothetical protein